MTLAGLMCLTLVTNNARPRAFLIQVPFTLLAILVVSTLTPFEENLIPGSVDCNNFGISLVTGETKKRRNAHWSSSSIGMSAAVFHRCILLSLRSTPRGLR